MVGQDRNYMITMFNMGYMVCLTLTISLVHTWITCERRNLPHDRLGRSLQGMIQSSDQPSTGRIRVVSDSYDSN